MPILPFPSSPKVSQKTHPLLFDGSTAQLCPCIPLFPVGTATEPSAYLNWITLPSSPKLLLKAHSLILSESESPTQVTIGSPSPTRSIFAPSRKQRQKLGSESRERGSAAKPPEERCWRRTANSPVGCEPGARPLPSGYCRTERRGQCSGWPPIAAFCPNLSGGARRLGRVHAHAPTHPWWPHAPP
jgi:hypothetical protein